MNIIKRYNFVPVVVDFSMLLDVGGDWILYKDHLAALDALQTQLDVAESKVAYVVAMNKSHLQTINSLNDQILRGEDDGK